MKREVLDELDGKILSLIKYVARISNSDIGEKVDLSRVAVNNRIERLENKED